MVAISYSTVKYWLSEPTLLEDSDYDTIQLTCIIYNLSLQPRDVDAADSSLDWEVQLTKELTALLSIKAETDMGDEVWHEVAENLGYTPREISNLRSNDSPMAAVIADYKRRGGMPHQFITALYKTGSPGNMMKQMNNRIGSTSMMEENQSG